MIKKLFLIVLYYLLVIFIHPTFDMHGDIILSGVYSRISNIVSIVFLVLELLLPVIFKFILRKNFKKTFIYCFTFFLFYVILVMIGWIIICDHYKEFSTERWNNRNLCYIREFMLDDLRDNYKLKGKSKEEIYKLLGRTENDRCQYQEHISQSSSYHELCYKIESGYIFFCLFFDERGNVEKTYIKDSENSYTYDES